MSRFPKMQKFLKSKGYRRLEGVCVVWAHPTQQTWGFMFWFAGEDEDQAALDEPLECVAPVVLLKEDRTNGFWGWGSPDIDPRVYKDPPGVDFSKYTFSRLVVDHFMFEEDPYRDGKPESIH
jgi:hypothetical protein